MKLFWKMTLNLHYWPIRGLNEPIVTLAEHMGLQYKLHSVESREIWMKQKDELVKKGFEFPNLPYTERSGKYVSESVAIMAQLVIDANRHEFLPTQKHMTEFLELVGVTGDINQSVTGPAYGSKTLDDLKDLIKSNMARHKIKLQMLADRLANHPWLMGDQLTILDFRFAETVERMKVMNKELGFDDFGIDFSGLDAYLKRFLELSGVKEYRGSSRFRARPFNNTQAIWK